MICYSIINSNIEFIINITFNNNIALYEYHTIDVLVFLARSCSVFMSILHKAIGDVTLFRKRSNLSRTLLPAHGRKQYSGVHGFLHCARTNNQMYKASCTAQEQIISHTKLPHPGRKLRTSVNVFLGSKSGAPGTSTFS